MIVGPTGSGKTVCVKHVMSEAKDQKGVLCSYLVADTSIYQILKTIAANFGIETSNRLINTNEYWTKIEERVKGNIGLIILDEIDKMLIKNRNEVYSLIYKFTRDPNICLIGITNDYDIRQRSPTQGINRHISTSMSLFPRTTLCSSGIS